MKDKRKKSMLKMHRARRQIQFGKILSCKGYTLIELTITVLLFTFLLGAIFLVLNTSNISWGVESVEVELHQELRKGMEAMVQDLPAAGISKITGVPVDGNPHSTITFEKAVGVDAGGNVLWSNPIQYVLSGTTPNRLLRRVGGVDTILANNIQSIAFSRQNGSARILEVLLTAADTTPTGQSLTSSLSFQVKIRN